MRTTRDKPEVRTAQMMQGIIVQAFEKLEKGDKVDLKRLEEVLRFLMLMMEKTGSRPLDIDKTVRAVMSEYEGSRSRLRLINVSQKKRLVLGEDNLVPHTGEAV